MDKFNLQNLANNLTIVFFLLIMVTATILVTIHYFSYNIISRQQMNVRMSNTYDLAKAMVMPIWNSDLEMLRQISEAYLSCEYISGIRLETDYGKILYDNLSSATGESFTREEMIRQSDHYFGRLKLQFSGKGTEQTIRKTIFTVIVLSLPLIVGVIIGSHVIIKLLLRKAFKH